MDLGFFLGTAQGRILQRYAPDGKGLAFSQDWIKANSTGDGLGFLIFSLVLVVMASEYRYFNLWESRLIFAIAALTGALIVSGAQWRRMRRYALAGRGG